MRRERRRGKEKKQHGRPVASFSLSHRFFFNNFSVSSFLGWFLSVSFYALSSVINGGWGRVTWRRQPIVCTHYRVRRLFRLLLSLRFPFWSSFLSPVTPLLRFFLLLLGLGLSTKFHHHQTHETLYYFLVVVVQVEGWQAKISRRRVDSSRLRKLLVVRYDDGFVLYVTCIGSTQRRKWMMMELNGVGWRG